MKQKKKERCNKHVLIEKQKQKEEAGGAKARRCQGRTRVVVELKRVGTTLIVDSTLRRNKKLFTTISAEIEVYRKQAVKFLGS